MDKERKEEFLRGVYEENKRINERSFSSTRRGRRRAAAGLGGLFIVVALLLVAVRLLSSEEVPNDVVQDPALRGSSMGIPVPKDSVDASSAAEIGDLSRVQGPLVDLFDLGVRTIVIDPGHGGVDPGASGIGGLHEKEITLNVALRLRRRLVDQHGLQVVMTRESDSTLSLRDRVLSANEVDPDLFISIHVNWFPSSPVYALETYYFGTGTDDSAIRKAERENRNSDYSVAEFNRLLKGFGDRVKLDESNRLAQSIQQSMFRNTSMLNEQVRSWGVKSAPFVVLVGVDAPGILAEIGVISNEDEERKLATPEYREKLALFMEEGIVNYIGSLDASGAEQNEE